MHTEWGVYLHIPFCRSKCSYCAFVSQVASSQVQQNYIAALCREISAASGDFSVPSVDTVFFGGGTPSLLQAQDIERILTAVRNKYPFRFDAEISLEANPGTVSEDKLKELRRAGINRLSLGVQSFDDEILKGIGRSHLAADARRTIEAARRAGFKNISLDLMYGLPEQTLACWQDTLEQAVKLSPEHVSVYGLKLEEGTDLECRAAQGRVSLPDEEQEEAMYDMANEFLPQQGYRRYEISNFCLDGQECRHNLKYWNYEPFQGFGVAAHSFDGRSRRANTDSIEGYIEQMRTTLTATVFSEELSKDTGRIDYIITGLRKNDGMDIRRFNEQFDCDFSALYLRQIEELRAGGWLQQEESRVFLTAKGFKVANRIMEKFLP